MRRVHFIVQQQQRSTKYFRALHTITSVVHAFAVAGRALAQHSTFHIDLLYTIKIHIHTTISLFINNFTLKAPIAYIDNKYTCKTRIYCFV